MVAELCKRYDVICLMDEVYEWLTYDGNKHLCVCVRVCVNLSEARRKKSERVLVFSELGISRAATAVIAYLIQRNKCSLQVIVCVVMCACREQFSGLHCYVEE